MGQPSLSGWLDPSYPAALIPGTLGHSIPPIAPFLLTFETPKSKSRISFWPAQNVSVPGDAMLVALEAMVRLRPESGLIGMCHRAPWDSVVLNLALCWYFGIHIQAQRVLAGLSFIGRWLLLAYWAGTCVGSFLQGLTQTSHSVSKVAEGFSWRPVTTSCLSVTRASLPLLVGHNTSAHGRPQPS